MKQWLQKYWWIPAIVCWVAFCVVVDLLHNPEAPPRWPDDFHWPDDCEPFRAPGPEECPPETHHWSNTGSCHCRLVPKRKMK